MRIARQHRAQCVLRAVAAPFRRLAFFALRAMSRRQQVLGVQVVNAAGESSAPLISKLVAAVQLIAAQDPIRFSRIRRDLRTVMLSLAGGPEYLHFARTCMLGAPDVATQGVERVAMTIVHEATHARLGRVGLDTAYHQRARIERLCVEAEINFAKRLPDSDRLIADAQRALQEPWYSEKQIFERHLHQLQTLGRPEWLLRAYRRFLAPRE